MEVDDIQTQTHSQPQPQPQHQQQPPQPEPPSKYSTRVSSNGGTHNELVVVGSTENSTRSRRATTSGGGGGGGLMGELMVGNSSNSRFGRQWQHSSRIIRVSRASGGKDRHSKVWTAKGPRDRRVRLSVTTAIQFYDLQDRLGYDQPSKAVEWLIKAASDAINELPGLNTESFPQPETPPPNRQLSGGDERKIDGGGVLDTMVDDLGHQQDHQNHQQRQQQQMGSKSGCSSNNSETSKGSGGLSLSRTRSEIRVKARERARERTNNNMAQTSSFTQLLTAGMNHSNTNNKHSTSVANDDNNNSSSNNNNNNQWLSSGSSAAGQMADYFGTGLIGVGNNNNNTSVMTTIASFGSENHHHQQQLQQQQQQPHFPFLSDQHLIQVANGANNSGNGGGGGDYNLNFSISSTPNTSTSGYNNSRGTLQSNSPSLLPYLQRFSAATDGSSLPFFLGNAAVSSDHQHQFQPPGLQLCYGDPGRRQSSDHKGKGKN